MTLGCRLQMDSQMPGLFRGLEAGSETKPGNPVHPLSKPVPPGKSVVAGQAAFRYSWMRPSHRLVRSTVTVAEVASGGLWTGVGGFWPRDWWGRCWL